ncbi:MAG: FxsA family protein [Planctomycetes bacterium]|nr:FxsA family protein [Planctomycetota bacterium]
MRLIALFIIIPLLDFMLLFKVAALIGGWQTVFIVIFTGITGASLAKHQGIMVWSALQRDLAEGKLPTDTMISGVLVLIGAVLLLTPGILTDFVGFMLMIPGNRKLIGTLTKKQLAKHVKVNNINIRTSPFPSEGGIKDAEGVRVIDEENDAP